jgi:hypothetical protein
MMDSYFDRCDAASGYQATTRYLDHNDARYFGGQLYATVIDRMVAEAKFELQGQLAFSVAHHKRQVRDGFAQARAGGAA